MKLLTHHMQRIEYLYGIGSWSPLEIAAELGLTFRQVCAYLDKHCLRKMDIAIARDIPKATRAHICPIWDYGFTNPFARP